MAKKPDEAQAKKPEDTTEEQDIKREDGASGDNDGTPTDEGTGAVAMKGNGEDKDSETAASVTREDLDNTQKSINDLAKRVDAMAALNTKLVDKLEEISSKTGDGFEKFGEAITRMDKAFKDLEDGITVGRPDSDDEEGATEDKVNRSDGGMDPNDPFKGVFRLGR